MGKNHLISHYYHLSKNAGLWLARVEVDSAASALCNADQFQQINNNISCCCRPLGHTGLLEVEVQWCVSALLSGH